MQTINNNSGATLSAARTIWNEIRNKCPEAFLQLLTYQYGSSMSAARTALLDANKFDRWIMATPWESLYRFFDKAGLYIDVYPVEPFDKPQESLEFPVMFTFVVMNSSLIHFSHRNSLVKYVSRAEAELYAFVSSFELYQEYIKNEQKKDS